MAINIPTKIPQLVGIPAGALEVRHHLVAFFICSVRKLEQVGLTRPFCFFSHYDYSHFNQSSLKKK
jgi:hypothetical protein